MQFVLTFVQLFWVEKMIVRYEQSCSYGYRRKG